MASEKPDARRMWGRLMPGSARARFILLGKALLGAIALGGVMATFAVSYGWPAVLRFSLMVLVLMVIFFSGFLHYRAWIVIREEMNRADEAAAEAEKVKTALEQLPKAMEEAGLEVANYIIAEMNSYREKLGLPPLATPPSSTAPAPAPTSSPESSE